MANTLRLLTFSDLPGTCPQEAAAFIDAHRPGRPRLLELARLGSARQAGQGSW